MKSNFISNLAPFQKFLVDADAHGVDADVVDVVRLVEDHDGVSGQVFRHNLGNLWVKQIVVTVDDDVGLSDHQPDEKKIEVSQT